MDEKQNLESFFYSIKDTLPFEDEKDFQRKIQNDKEFQIKIQKLVYLAKFFGWENDYHFNFHEHGPYSFQLSEDYHEISRPNNSNVKLITNHEFNEFVENQDIDYLESASTLIYYI